MAHYDLLVIGTGPAGQKAAVQAAKLGKHVGIIERKEMVGGVCIHTGTIPSKSLREAVLARMETVNESSETQAEEDMTATEVRGDSDPSGL